MDALLKCILQYNKLRLHHHKCMSENVLAVYSYIRMARIPVYVLGVCVPRYVKKNTNARQLEITIPLSACGTQGGLTYRTHPSGGGGGAKRGDRQTDRQTDRA